MKGRALFLNCGASAGFLLLFSQLPLVMVFTVPLLFLLAYNSKAEERGFWRYSATLHESDSDVAQSGDPLKDTDLQQQTDTASYLQGGIKEKDSNDPNEIEFPSDGEEKEQEEPALAGKMETVFDSEQSNLKSSSSSEAGSDKMSMKPDIVNKVQSDYEKQIEETSKELDDQIVSEEAAFADEVDPEIAENKGVTNIITQEEVMSSYDLIEGVPYEHHQQEENKPGSPCIHEVNTLSLQALPSEEENSNSINCFSAIDKDKDMPPLHITSSQMSGNKDIKSQHLGGLIFLEEDLNREQLDAVLQTEAQSQEDSVVVSNDSQFISTIHTDDTPASLEMPHETARTVTTTFEESITINTTTKKWVMTPSQIMESTLGEVIQQSQEDSSPHITDPTTSRTAETSKEVGTRNITTTSIEEGNKSSKDNNNSSSSENEDGDEKNEANEKNWLSKLKEKMEDVLESTSSSSDDDDDEIVQSKEVVG